MEPKSEYRSIISIALIIVIIMGVLVTWQYTQAATYPGTIVLPAGNTYLGPNSPNQVSSPGAAPIPAASNVFTVDPTTPWHEVHGSIYPYTMSVPTTLTLTTFKNDPFDLQAIVWGNIDPASNVLVGVDNLKTNTNRSQYLNRPTIDYVRDWWQQFNSLKGVASIDLFTNKAGLKGYKTKFFDSTGATPNTDVFFEVPGHQELVIHLANGTLDPAVFDKIVDSVHWKL